MTMVLGMLTTLASCNWLKKEGPPGDRECMPVEEPGSGTCYSGGWACAMITVS